MHHAPSIKSSSTEYWIKIPEQNLLIKITSALPTVDLNPPLRRNTHWYTVALLQYLEASYCPSLPTYLPTSLQYTHTF